MSAIGREADVEWPRFNVRLWPFWKSSTAFHTQEEWPQQQPSNPVSSFGVDMFVNQDWSG
jgi:hypothetical protein